MSTFASWASHHLPAGTSVRCLLDPADDETPIRLLFGPSDQLELALSPDVAAPLITVLREATADLGRD